MVGLRFVIFIAFILVVNAHKHDYPQAPRLCNNNPNIYSRLPPCSSTTESTTSTTTTEEDSSEEVTVKPTDSSDSTTDESTALERAHWCRFSNGTFASLGFTFLHNPCSLCRCTKLRSFHCQPLQCMPTYCINNARPVRPNGECCTRCASDPPSTSCVYNGTTYPHGVVIKSVADKMQCWCHFGNIECRQYMSSLLGSVNLLSNGVVVYFVAMIILSVLFFGLIIWCGCTIGIYYYYKQNQQVFQDAYNQYNYSAGWQPMEEEEEEETVVDSAAEEKRLEAEKYQYANDNSEVIPPPYGIHNSDYVSEQK